MQTVLILLSFLRLSTCLPLPTLYASFLHSQGLSPTSLTLGRSLSDTDYLLGGSLSSAFLLSLSGDAVHWYLTYPPYSQVVDCSTKLLCLFKTPSNQGHLMQLEPHTGQPVSGFLIEELGTQVKVAFMENGGAIIGWVKEGRLMVTRVEDGKMLWGRTIGWKSQRNMLTEIAIAADKVVVAGMVVLGQGKGWDRGGMVKIDA
jgi:hypothetical protein